MADYAWAAGLPCVICDRPFERRADITCEHLIPLRRGGSNDLGNMGPAHKGCNSGWSKGARTTEQ